MKKVDFEKFNKATQELLTQIEAFIADVIRKYGDEDGYLAPFGDSSWYIVGLKEDEIINAYYIEDDALGNMNVVEVEEIGWFRIIDEAVFVSTDKGCCPLTSLPMSDIIACYNALSECVNE